MKKEMEELMKFYAKLLSKIYQWIKKKCQSGMWERHFDLILSTLISLGISAVRWSN